MAFVDFSNAQLHLPSSPTFNITNNGNVCLSNNVLTNASGQTIVSNYNHSITINEQKKQVHQYTGTFTASGTEFYLGDKLAVNQKYKITGISFQNGDNYSFEIPVTLTCN